MRQRIITEKVSAAELAAVARPVTSTLFVVTGYRATAADAVEALHTISEAKRAFGSMTLLEYQADNPLPRYRGDLKKVRRIGSPAFDFLNSLNRKNEDSIRKKFHDDAFQVKYYMGLGELMDYTLVGETHIANIVIQPIAAPVIELRQRAREKKQMYLEYKPRLPVSITIEEAMPEVLRQFAQRHINGSVENDGAAERIVEHVKGADRTVVAHVNIARAAHLEMNLPGINVVIVTTSIMAQTIDIERGAQEALATEPKGKTEILAVAKLYINLLSEYADLKGFIPAIHSASSLTKLEEIREEIERQHEAAHPRQARSALDILKSYGLQSHI